MTRNSLFTRTALGLALALGVAAPAVAAEKKPAQAPKVQFSKEFIKAAADLDKTVGSAGKNPAIVALSQKVRAAGTNAQAKAAAVAEVDAALGGNVKGRIDAAAAVATTPGDKLKIGELTRTYGVLTDDQALQFKGATMMLDTGVLTPAAVGPANWIAGVAAYQLGDYAAAAKYVQAAKTAGFQDPQLEGVLTDAYKRSNNMGGALQNAQSDIAAAKAAGRSPSETSIRTALQAAYDGKQAAASADLSAMLVQYYPAPAGWTSAISVVRALGNYGPQQRLDLWRLALQTKTLDERGEYIEYIQDADPRRSPGEVLKIIQLATASGKLKTTDLVVSEARPTAEARMAKDKTELPLLERGARTASARNIDITAAADAFLSYEDYAKAADLYKLALAKPGIDQAEVLTRLGIAQTMLGQSAEAQASFAKVTGPRQAIAKLWAVYAVQKAGGATAPTT